MSKSRFLCVYISDIKQYNFSDHEVRVKYRFISSFLLQSQPVKALQSVSPTDLWIHWTVHWPIWLPLIFFYPFFQIALIRSSERIKVERPVTRPPPHRSRRAVLPHRALRICSLTHWQALCKDFQLLMLTRILFSNLRSGYQKLVQQVFESGPVVTQPLATPVEPFKQDASCLVIECLQTAIITWILGRSCTKCIK